MEKEEKVRICKKYQYSVKILRRAVAVLEALDGSCRVDFPGRYLSYDAHVISLMLSRYVARLDNILRG